MKIIWSPLAVERLESIYDYISQDNISAASDLTERIFTKVESLLENTNRGRVVPEANRQNIREIFAGEYRIIYRVEKDQVTVLTIRNFKQLLPDSEMD